MLNNEYQFDGGSVTPLKPDLVLVCFDDRQKVTRESVEKAHECKSELLGSKLHGCILDCSKGFSKFSAEAKSLILSNIDPYDKNAATVLLVSNALQKMEISIFIKLHPSSDNVHIVKSKKEALDLIRKEINLKKSLSVAS